MGSSLGRVQMILVANIPFIAKKFGSKVIGSRTTTNIRAHGWCGQIPARHD
jgi:hypothetical protein